MRRTSIILNFKSSSRNAHRRLSNCRKALCVHSTGELSSPRARARARLGLHSANVSQVPASRSDFISIISRSERARASPGRFDYPNANVRDNIFAKLIKQQADLRCVCTVCSSQRSLPCYPHRNDLRQSSTARLASQPEASSFNPLLSTPADALPRAMTNLFGSPLFALPTALQTVVDNDTRFDLFDPPSW